MCTAMTIQVPQGHVYFGRTMDFSYPLDPELYFIPRGYTWKNILRTHTIQDQYSILAIGQNLFPVVFADGVNDMGFAAAVLYFPGYAHYDTADTDDSSRLPAASIELVHFLLGQCASAEQAIPILKNIRIVGVKDSVTNTVAPLHWILADKTGTCLVVEKTADGLHILPNPAGVLSNSPDFIWHMTNLRSYMNIEPTQKADEAWGPVSLSPFGQGAGTLGLPGDYTPPSRFVRTAFQKSHADFPPDREGTVNTCFHIMESVSIPKGVVMTDRGTPDYTQYTAFISLEEKRYYFKTYDNTGITAVHFPSGPNFTTKPVSLGKLNQPPVIPEWKS